MKAGLMIAKAGVLATWAWAIAGSLGVQVPGAEYGIMVVIGLVAAHAVEIGVLLPKLRDVAGSPASHAVGLLVFGVFHYKGALLDK